MKKLVIALMAFALVITLAGCGGGGGSSFTLDRGDDGKWLKDNGFTEVKTAYDDMNSVFANNNKSNDPDGKIRANAFAGYVSEDYTGKSTLGSARAFTSVKNKKEIVARLQSLIKDKQFQGLQIIAYGKGQTGAEKGKTVTLETKLYVESLVYNGGTFKNQEYKFSKVQWVNDGTAEKPAWKIKSGLDDLGKNSSEL